MKYRYLVSGITIASDIYFPQLLQTTGEARVTIQYGSVPEHLENNEVDFPVVEANSCQYLLKIPGIGRYLAEDGNSITLEAVEGVAITEVNNYVLTSVLGALSYMHGFVPIHGGAFLLNGKAVLISGQSGVGKSCLLAALSQKGYAVIADDISNVKFIDGKPLLYPAFPAMMIWKDTMEKLNIDPGLCDSLRSDMEKYFLLLNPAHFNKTVEIGAIYILRGDGEDESGMAVKGMAKVNALQRSLFQPWMANLDLMGNKNACFKQLLSLASHISMYYYTNNRVLPLDELSDAFLATLEKNAE